MTNSLTPIEVADYTPDFITNVIRFVTRWSSRSEVLDKAHIVYLTNYLNHIGVKTVVFESDYVDRHYLEDYSEYYARCFQSLPKTCARLHFFRTEFKEEAFSNALNNLDRNFIDSHIKREGAYAGFAVIRPLPVTCIARMCLMPYEFGDSSLVLTDRVHVSLFGIDLTVNTAAFIEQDKVVSACATSAIWALLNANRTYRSELLPSPSAITKSALVADRNGSRTFPAAAGLQVEHVCRSLKTYGLEPTVIDKQDYEDEYFPDIVKRILGAYLPSNIPVLIGGRVSQVKDGIDDFRGEHLVCALGYRTNGPITSSSPEEINRIYVHDDRYGPYVSLAEDPAKGGAFTFELKQQRDGHAPQCIRKEKFEPQVLIIGLNHKVRIDFDYALNVAAAISELIGNYSEDHPEKCPPEFAEFAGASFQVSLCYSSALKTDFVEADHPFFSYNGTAESASFLSANMPKYVWRCRFLHQQDVFADILLDATGVPQGDLVLGCLAYTKNADAFWRALSMFVKEDYYRDATSDLDPSVPNVIGCITRFFLNFEDNYLDADYGPLRIPARKYRGSEVDDYGDQITRSDVIKIVRGNDAAKRLETLDHNQAHVWVIDRFGDLIIGEEPADDPAKKGHPALTGGQPARLGGEMHYCKADGYWELNTKSGTYSGHLFGDPERAATYLASVISNNLLGCKVRQQTTELPAGARQE